MLPESKIAKNLNFYRNRRAQNEFEVKSTSRDTICSKENRALFPQPSFCLHGKEQSSAEERDCETEIANRTNGNCHLRHCALKYEVKDLEYPCQDSDDAVDCHEHHCSIENDLATYNNKSNNYNEDGYCWYHFSDELYCPDHEEYGRKSHFVAVYCNFDNCNNYTLINEVFCPGEQAADDQLLQCTKDNLKRFPCHEWLKITRNTSNF